MSNEIVNQSQKLIQANFVNMTLILVKIDFNITKLAS